MGERAKHDFPFHAAGSITVLISQRTSASPPSAPSLNMLLGLLLAFRYSPTAPGRIIDSTISLSNWTGTLPSPLHSSSDDLLLNKNPRSSSSISFTLYIRPPALDNSIRPIALCCLHLSLSLPLRIRLGAIFWKSFHFSIYFAAAALSGTLFSRSHA